MIRTPLRPLARILQARARGENPDAIERENRRLRHEAMKDRSRARSEVRLVVLAFLVALGFGAVAVRMGTLAAVKPTEPETAGGGAASIIAQRGRLAVLLRRGRHELGLAQALIALAPGTPQHGVPRERAESAVRQAEAELLEAYHRLTFGVKPREDEIDWSAIDTSAPAPRGKARRLPTTAGYHTRIDTLKADITKAQERLDAARERYYASN